MSNKITAAVKFVWWVATWPITFAWRWFQKHRSARAVLIYTPACIALLMLALRVAGIGFEDQQAKLLELAPKSGFVVCIIALAAGWMALTGMDLANSFRCRLQKILIDEDGAARTNRAWLGAFVILAGESMAWAFALYQIGRMLLRWQS